MEQKDKQSLEQKYATKGHPSIEELIADQGLVFPRDPKELLGDFWPEDEPIEDFLAALDEWRGRKRKSKKPAA